MHIRYDDAGHGFDTFGLAPKTVERSARALRFLYKKYFRVSSFGVEHVPTDSGAILAANHSGTLPLDGVMIYLDVLEHTGRVPRPIMDIFVAQLPFVGTYFSRVGAVAGSRGNVRRLLDAGALLLVFPEGTPGIAKTYWQRYQLRKWRVGHAELALRHRVPVVPVAVIGAEEQWPLVARIDRFKLFGAPYLPIPATPLPMPVHYRIHYGEPIVLHEEFAAAAADDPEVIHAAAERVRVAEEALIEHGLAAREGVFR